MISHALAKLINTSAAQLAIDIRAGLATYDFGSGAVAAIFTGGVPDNTPTPYIAVNDISGTPDFGSRGSPGGTYTSDIQIIGRKDFSDKSVRDLAMKVWKLVHRANLDTWLNVAPFYLQTWVCNALLPQSTNDGLGFPGFTIRTSVTVLRTSSTQ
jgi:hypothetical protein